MSNFSNEPDQKRDSCEQSEGRHGNGRHAPLSLSARLKSRTRSCLPSKSPPVITREGVGGTSVLGVPRSLMSTLSTLVLSDVVLVRLSVGQMSSARSCGGR